MIKQTFDIEDKIDISCCRSENNELHQGREIGRREQQALSRENEKITRKLEVLLKLVLQTYM